MNEIIRTRRLARPLRPVALAAIAAVLSGLAAGASAQQYYDYSGSVAAGPINVFPFDKFTSFHDFTGTGLFIGSPGVGTFSAFAGSLMRLDSLNLGDGGTGDGTVTIDGFGARMELKGLQNRLQVGNWGAGNLTVSGGAALDASLDVASCAANSCRTFIGNAAGSTASLTVTGIGSEVRTVRYFGVAQAAVFSGFGTPGGTTTASVNVLNGGTLRTETASISSGPGGAIPLGTEHTDATVNIDGTGSQWIVSRNSIDNSTAFLSAASHANATAAINVTNGGKLTIDGTGSVGPFDGANIAQNGGHASLTVSGVGSSFSTINSANAFMNVGSGTSGSVGSFEILAGARGQTLNIAVGRGAGNQGSLLIDGAGSRLTLTGVGSAGNGSAFATIGRDGGTGTALISNGGRLVITDAGGDSFVANGSPGFQVGRTGGSGTMTITGAGSLVQVTASSRNPASGQPDNLSGFIAVGRDTGSTGTLNVLNGAKLLMQSNNLSIATAIRNATLNLGGSDDSGNGGTGNVLVSGAGSEIRLTGTADPSIQVGRSSSLSTLRVENQGSVRSLYMEVGRVGHGRLEVDGAGTTVTLSGVGSIPNVMGPGYMGIGRLAGGNGSAAITNGAQVFINDGGGNSAVNGFSPGLIVGREGASGTLLVSGTNSLIQLTSTSLGLPVGQPDNFNPFGSLGYDAGSSGQMVISGGGKVVLTGNAVSTVTDSRGTTFNIGGRNDVTPGGTGSASVMGLGSQLRVDGSDGFISVGRNTGNGFLSVTDQANVSTMIMNVGRNATGILVVDHATMDFSGQQTGSVLSGAGLSIGNRGGSGSATIRNGSVVTITNMGSSGASLNLGGTAPNPLGTGFLNLLGGSSINLVTAPGQSAVSIGRDGIGVALVDGASSINTGSGSVYLGRLATGDGELRLRNASTLNAGYVGVGAASGADTGIGSLFVSSGSSVTATTVEVGFDGLLGGSGGTVNGHVILRGTLAPGESPGKIIINGPLSVQAEGRIVLDVQDDGHGGFITDELVLMKGSDFDLAQAKIQFNFLGDTDPNAFFASGQFDMDTFLRSRDGNVESALSTVFQSGQDWRTVLSAVQFSARSADFQVRNLDVRVDGTFDGRVAAIPEPQTWALMLAGLGWMATLAARRRRR